MHKIDGDRAVNGQFVPEDPGAGLPPTQLTPDWCNDVQRELTDLIEHQDGGATFLQKGVAQIRAAVAAMIARPVAAINQALSGKVSKAGDTVSGDLDITDGTNSVYLSGAAGFLEICRTDGVGGIDIKSNRLDDYDVRLQKDIAHGLNIFTGGNGNTQHKVRIGSNGQPALLLYRQNSVDEGAQLDLARALDNATAWAIDVLGAGGVTNFRVINTFAGEAVIELLGASGRVYTKHGFQFQDGSIQGSAGLGFGQTWQDVTSSRLSMTTYNNTTGRPKNVKFIGDVVGFRVNGSLWAFNPGIANLDIIIPVDATYQIIFSRKDFWLELG